MKSGLKWTGERLVPTELHEIAVEHLARYAFCMPLMQSKTVLDLACGEGYGTHLLSQAAKEIIGVDIDRLTVAHAQARYGNGKTKFAEAPANKLPFEDSYFDVAVSFETLEHLYEQDEMIGEIKRVLKKDGALIISTPNKEEHSRISPEVNPFHAKELDKEEFKKLLGRHFTQVSFFHQQNCYGSFIYPENQSFQGIKEASGDFTEVRTENHLISPPYFLAIASNILLPSSTPLFYHAGNIYEKRFIALKKTVTYRLGHLLLSPVKWLNKKK